MDIVDTPDEFGHTIFCDDIRFESGGKITYVGAYDSTMFVNSDFPVVLPKFALSLFFIQKRTVFDPNIGIRVFLPGDGKENASIEGSLKDVLTESEFSKLLNQAQGDKEYISLRANLICTPLVIKCEGSIKARVEKNGKLYRLGMLHIEKQIGNNTQSA